MLSPESEVLLRNNQYFEAGNWLIINATDPDVFSHFPDSVVGFHQFFDSYINIHKQAKGEHVYDAFLESDAMFDGVVVYWPKSKQHGVMLCQHALSKLNKKGLLLIVGNNKGGIKSAGKTLDKEGFSIQKLDSARHCTLLGCQMDEYLENIDFDKYVNTYFIELSDTKLKMQTLPGAFSSDSLDPATEMLLEDIDSLFGDYKNKSSCKVLDFACGNGAIGLSIASLYSNTQITMSDINALALDCANANITNNHLDTNRIKIINSNILDDVSGKFDVIVSNPPFHSGTKTDYSITEKFLRDAKQHLIPGGKLRIVANRFLKYPDQLAEIFGNMKTLSKNSKFSVYESTNS